MWACSNLPILVVAELLTELAQLRNEAILLDGVLDGDVEGNLAESLGIVGLDDVVGGAEAHGFDDGLRLLAAGQHDHLQLRSGCLQRLQRLNTVHARHGDVEQHDVRRLALTDGGNDLVAPRVRAGFVAANAEKCAQVSGEPRVVVDDGNRRAALISGGRGGGRRGRTGASDCGHRVDILVFTHVRGKRSADVARARGPLPDQTAPP